MTRSSLIALLALSSTVVVTRSAYAEDGGADVSIVRAQFTDRIDNRLPVGEPSSLAQGKLATYWVEVSNPGVATAVTLVWKLDGKEAARQSLEVGHAGHWRTWGMCGTQKAHVVEVEVLDNDGRSIKTDSIALSPA